MQAKRRVLLPSLAHKNSHTFLTCSLFSIAETPEDWRRWRVKEQKDGGLPGPWVPCEALPHMLAELLHGKEIIF
jgi:hypothetical protein